MKKIILFLLFMFCFNNVNAAQTSISDIENHWAKENIVRMLINGNVSGYDDNTFRPNNEVTTLEFIKMITETLNIKLAKEGLNKWPDYYIATAKKYNLEYDYYKKLTRYEATQIISTLIDLKDVNASSNKFKDLESKYKSNVLKLVKLKIVNGYEDKTFRGNQTITRAEATTIALRTLEAYSTMNSQNKYSINEKYTNVGYQNNTNSEIDKIRYEIKNGKIYFKDEGRFSYHLNYTINEKYISNKKIIKLIETLVSENSYTAVYYVPSKYIINQLIINFGEDDNYINKGLEYFSFTYYEDKLYDLNRITLKEEFSSECYLKINIDKLWTEQYKFENGEYIDENIKIKLLKAIKIEFEEKADEILTYMVDKYLKNMNGEYKEEVIVEQNIIGKYIINFYKTEKTSLEFYFEKFAS